MEREQNWKADVDAYLRRKDSSAAAAALGKILKKETRRRTREAALASRLLGIYEEERRAGEKYTVLDGTAAVDEAVSRFTWVKLLLRRLEFDLPKEHWQELYRYCEEQHISVTMLASILRANITCREETCRRLAALYEKNEGEQPGRARYFDVLFRELSRRGEQDGK